MSDKAKDHHPFGFPPVLNDVMLEDQFTDRGWFARCWDTNIRVAPDKIEPVLKDLIVAISLFDSPHFEGVQEDASAITLCSWGDEQVNT